MFKLDGKTAIVTGGGSGIGRAISLALAQQGANVHVLDLSEQQLAETLDKGRQQGGQLEGHICDVSHWESVSQVIGQIGKQIEEISLLVNNAGIASIGNVEQTNEEEFVRLFNVNVKGVFFCMKAALPYMKAKGGSIINMASIASIVGLPDRFAYSMSKGAVWMMTLSAARDYLPFNIRVNAISPARIHTPFVEGFLSRHYPGKEQEVFQELSKTQPIGRMGKPEEVAALVVYLASDEAAFVTGSNYTMDGGFVHLNTP